MIFTFYSYKGGVGRSMALANIAHLMCDCGLNVLVVDWDLEAPGLERFLFNKPRDIENALKHKGLLDMLLDYKDALFNFRPEEKKPFFPPYQISDYIIPIIASRSSLGGLSLLPAGERAHEKFTEYSNKVKSFDWQDFDQNWKGEIYFEWLREELEKQSDVVLIDSRTGVTEMGGVCTYQMADTIVMFSSAHDQSIDGTFSMLESFSDPELPNLRNGRKLTTIVIPSRIEQTAEIEILNNFRAKFSQRFKKYLSDELTSESDFFLNHEIPHVPRYAFEELVAVKQTNTKLRATQLEDAYKRLLVTLSKITPQDSILRKKIHQEDKTTKLEDKITKLSEAEPHVVRRKIVKKILILPGNSKNTSRQQFEEQVREIDNGLQRAQHHYQFELVQKWAVRPRDIQRAMLDVRPQIVHFLVRAAGSQGRELENENDRKLIPLPEDGTESEGLVFEDETGQAKLVRREALAALCKLFADKLMCVVLNGCYSKEQAEEIAKYIPYVVGTKQVIGNKAAINFAVGFYDALGAGRSVADAYKFGCVAIKFQFERFSEDLKPLLHKKKYSIPHIQPKRNKSERLEEHYNSVIKAITECRIVPFLGSDINLCDRPIQGNGEPEPWKPDDPFPPSGKDLAAYLAKTFPPPAKKIIWPFPKQQTEIKPGELPGELINEVLHENATLVSPYSQDRLTVGGLNLPYLSQYANLTHEGEFYAQLRSLELGDQPNTLHKFFATLPAIMREKGYYPPYPLIVTSNYDRALERAFEEAGEPFDLVFYSNAIYSQEEDKFVHRTLDGECREIIHPNEYQGLSFEQRPVILKLYGSVDQLKEGRTLVITEENYIEYFVSRNVSKLLPVQLHRKLRYLKPDILFLGYTLGDWNQRIILHRIWTRLTSTKSGWSSIQPDAEPLAQKLWKSYDVDLYDIPLRDYITELEQRVRDIPVKGDKDYE